MIRGYFILARVYGRGGVSAGTICAIVRIRERTGESVDEFVDSLVLVFEKLLSSLPPCNLLGINGRG